MNNNIDNTSPVRNRLKQKIKYFSIRRDELRKILRMLEERSLAAAEIELSSFKQQDQTDEEYENTKINIRDGFRLRPTINGVEGKEIFGYIDEVFDSPNFPDQVLSVYVNNSIFLKSRYNFVVSNSFEIFLDFSKPDLFNLSFMPSQETPNGSNIVVEGYDATWVHGVFNEFYTYVELNHTKLRWLHKHSVYDFALFVMGLPIGFWLAYKSSSSIATLFGGFSSFVQNASYVYVFFVALMLFRLSFHYARWVFPLVEYRCDKNRSLKHRFVLFTVVVTVISTVINDVLELLV